MKKPSLSDRILNYHRKHKGVWIPQGEIERLVTQRTTYTASNATRRCRELTEDGLLEVKYVKGHAHHRYVPQKRILLEIEHLGDMVREVEKVIYD